MQNGLVSVTRAEIIFATPTEIYEPKDAVPLGDVAGEVEFRDVHFAYGEGQPEILKGISFQTRKGEIVAFVGETGVGKVDRR